MAPENQQFGFPHFLFGAAAHIRAVDIGQGVFRAGCAVVVVIVQISPGQGQQVLGEPVTPDQRPYPRGGHDIAGFRTEFCHGGGDGLCHIPGGFFPADPAETPFSPLANPQHGVAKAPGGQEGLPVLVTPGAPHKFLSGEVFVRTDGEHAPFLYLGHHFAFAPAVAETGVGGLMGRLQGDGISRLPAIAVKFAPVRLPIGPGTLGKSLAQLVQNPVETGGNRLAGAGHLHGMDGIRQKFRGEGCKGILPAAPLDGTNVQVFCKPAHLPDIIRRIPLDIHCLISPFLVKCDHVPGGGIQERSAGLLAHGGPQGDIQIGVGAVQAVLVFLDRETNGDPPFPAQLDPLVIVFKEYPQHMPTGVALPERTVHRQIPPWASSFCIADMELRSPISAAPTSRSPS